ncbi:MAG: hypothetical protein OEV55_10655 [candidate division Zixibacteria bacterium]|nr:hypothetical protein [candidate division Zixibacteria bacterium]
MVKTTGLALAFLLLLSLFGKATSGEIEEDVKAINAIRVEKAPRIDGVLDDDCWKKAEKSGDFVQAQPHDGEPATESTYVQVCYDNDAL